MSYAKLFGSLVHSTIWREPDHVRIVWITMLVIADRDGLVEASIPGLADAARKSIAETEDALERLMAPDPYSRTPDFDGRRIDKAEGGWLLLNYERYRDRASAEEVKQKTAERQARKRERDKSRVTPESRSVTPSHAPSRDVTRVTTSCSGSGSSASATPVGERRAPACVASDVPPDPAELVPKTRMRSSMMVTDPWDQTSCSTEELPWQQWRAVSRAERILPGKATMRDRDACRTIEAHILEQAPYVAESRGCSVEDAVTALAAIGFEEFTRRFRETTADGYRGKRLQWRIGWVASMWAELTQGALPRAAE